MASRKTPKIASPGTKAPGAAKAKKTAPVVPDASLSAIAPGTDPSALIAKLCPVDIPGSIKILARYDSDRNTFESVNEKAKSARGTMNSTKKELLDKGWEKDAIGFAMKLSDMDPEMAQKVLAQTFVLCRSKVLDVPLGVINGTSGDLFDPDRVYKFGKATKDAPAPLAEKDSTPPTDAERRADLFENGRMMGEKGQSFKVPEGLPKEDEEVMKKGWVTGQRALLDKGGKPDVDNVVKLAATPKKGEKPAGTAASGDVEFR